MIFTQLTGLYYSCVTFYELLWRVSGSDRMKLTLRDQLFIFLYKGHHLVDFFKSRAILTTLATFFFKIRCWMCGNFNFFLFFIWIDEELPEFNVIGNDGDFFISVRFSLWSWRRVSNDTNLLMNVFVIAF